MQHKKEKRKVRGNKCKRKKTKTASKTHHKKRNSNQIKRNNKTIKSNKQKDKKKIENYFEQKFKIQKQQQPFYRILELALLNKEKILKEKQYQIKQHTHEHASTTQRPEEQKQSTKESTDIENILERKHKWKKKE